MDEEEASNPNPTIASAWRASLSDKEEMSLRKGVVVILDLRSLVRTLHSVFRLFGKPDKPDKPECPQAAGCRQVLQ